MVNTLYGDPDYQITPKQMEIFDKYCKVIQWGRQHPTRFLEEFMNLQFTDTQKYVLLSSWVPATCVWLASRDSGKCEILTSKVYTKVTDRGEDKRKLPFKTIGELKIGDLIYDDQGQLTKVIHLNPIIFDEVYEVEFEDGEIVECNGDHLWSVYDTNYTKNHGRELIVKDTRFLYQHFDDLMKKKKECRFHVPINRPIDYPDEYEYSIHPYLLGLWLGDGDSHTSRITSASEDVDEQIEILKPYCTFIQKEKGDKNSYYRICIDRKSDFNKNNIKEKTLTQKLKELNVLQNKHIPDDYLYGPIWARLALLQGLMDSDGSIRKPTERSKPYCVFTQKNEILAKQVFQLIESLGIKASIRYNKDKKNPLKDGSFREKWDIFYSASKQFPVFRLNRKYNQLLDELPNRVKQKGIVSVRKTGEKKAMRCITVDNDSGLYLTGEHYTVTHNSFMSAPFIMARTLLFPSHNTYIMGPTGGQAQETFTKLENLAKDNIASVVGITSVFLDECFRINSKADCFVHDKNSFTVKTFNGSTINTLNSVAKNIVGIRSNLNIYDEGGKIPRDFYALTQPFTAQNTDFIVGTGIDTDIYPPQLPNKTIYLSSAEGVDSEMFDQYKLCFEKMLQGNPNYFVCDLDCTHSIHPFMNGKPMKSLVTQEHVDNAMKVNPYKATREYYNKWDNDGGANVLVKRSTLNKNSQAYYPVYENDGQHKYIITYDPSSKLDNSEVLISEIFRDEEKGLMLRLVNMVNMIELLNSGEKVIKQKPEQIEDIKQMILDYNKGYLDYEGIEHILFDDGAGG